MTIRSRPRCSWTERIPCRSPSSQSFFSPRRFVAVLGSRTTSDPFETSRRRPRDPICLRRLDPRSSRLRYRQCRPARAAFCRRIEKPREDFIVPGAPSIRTTWPHGTPPSSVSSRPSTNVRTRLDASAACVTTAAPLRPASRDVSIENASSISSRMSRSRSSSAVGPDDPAAAGVISTVATEDTADAWLCAISGPISWDFSCASRCSGRSSKTLAKLTAASERFWRDSKIRPRSIHVSAWVGWIKVARSRIAAAVCVSPSIRRTRPSPSHACSSFGLSSRARRYPTADLYGRPRRRYASARRTQALRSSSSREMDLRSGSIASANRISRRSATESCRCFAASRFAASFGFLRSPERTYGLKRWPSPWAFARIPSTAAANTSELSSRFGSTEAAVRPRVAGPSVARLGAGFFPVSATTAVKTSPLVTRCRATEGSFRLEAAGLSSRRPQIRQLTASGRLNDAQPGHWIEFGMDHLWTDDRHHLESPFVEHERRESGLVVRTPHLLDPDPALDLDVRDRVHLELDDPVREERLVPSRLWGLESEVRRLRGRLREHERGRSEVSQPLEQPEELRAAILELREDLEGLERVDDNQVHPVDVLLRRHRPPEEFHPRFRRALPDLLLDRPDVEDVHVGADGLHVEPHRGHLGLEARSRLLQGDVQAFRVPLACVRVEDRIGQGLLHRPGQTRDDDDVSERKAAVEDVIETLDERRDLLVAHRASPNASGTR